MAELNAMLAATVTGADNVRKQAEQTLEQMLNENPAGFFVSLGGVLADNAADPIARQAAGLQMKLHLDAANQNTKMQRMQRWLTLAPEAKTQVKTGLVQTFASADRNARRTAAMVTAKVAAIDVPQGEWEDLIGGLVNTVTAGDNHAAKEASLECLGYLCEDMDAGVLTTKSNDILTAVVAGMRDPTVEIKLSATKAMENSIEFTTENFRNEEERNVIMAAILESAQCPNTEVMKHAFMCLVKVAENYYDELPAYMEAIFGQTALAIKNAGSDEGDEQDIGLQALEFWTSVCEEEAERIFEAEEDPDTENISKGYMAQVCPHLVPLLLEALCKQDDDQTEDTWNVSQSAAVCLKHCAQAIRDDIVALVMPFVTGNIQNENWRLREAACMTFGCILDGPNKQSVEPLVNEAIPIMLQKLQDPNVVVRDTSAWALGGIAEHHGALLAPGDLLNQYIGMLMNSLKDAPRVAYQACYALNELASVWSNDDRYEESYPLSLAFGPMIQAMLEACKRPDASEANLRTSAYNAISVVIENSAKDCSEATSQLLPVIMEELRVSFIAGLNPNEQLELQGALCGILNAIIQKLGGEVKPHADNIMLLLLQVFGQKAASVQEEAIMCVGAMADAVEKEFSKYMDSFMPHLQAGLANWEAADVCQAVRPRPRCPTLPSVSLCLTLSQFFCSGGWSCGRPVPCAGGQCGWVLRHHCAEAPGSIAGAQSESGRTRTRTHCHTLTHTDSHSH